MTFEDLELIDRQENGKTGRPSVRQLLKPSLYLELFVRWPDPEALAAFYAEVRALIEPHVRFHQTDAMARAARIGAGSAALDYFPSFLTSRRKHAWLRLSDVAGAGGENAPGGVGAFQFEAWVHKQSPGEGAAQVAQYLAQCAHFNCDLLHAGVRVTRLQVCVPVDFFPNHGAFADWVLGRTLVSGGRFFSGSAGYKIHLDQSYVHRGARDKLTSILHDLPGFDFDVGIGLGMGRVLSADRTSFVPVVKRVNWLTLVSDEGLALLGDADPRASGLSTAPDVSAQRLDHGLCLRAGEAPTLAREAPGLQSYFAVSRLLRPLRFRAHPRDHYSGLDDAAAKAWLYHFEKPPAP